MSFLIYCLRNSLKASNVWALYSIVRFALFQCLILYSKAILATEVYVLGNESMPWNGIVDGKEAGMTVEILREATRHGAPEFRFALGLPWARAQTMVHEQKGLPIAIVPLTRTAERETQYKWIAELIPNSMNLFTTGRKNPVHSVEEARDLSVGVFRGHATIPVLEQLGFSQIDSGAKDAEANVRKLLANRVDAIVEARAVGVYSWKKMGLDAGRLQIGPSIGESSHIYIAGDPSFPDDVAKQIADAVAQMRRDGSLKKILDSWMNPLARHEEKSE